ncbi:hypothetical protein MSG28_006915 [Choristoneura fumiferana]|uniref:Uncharacterized protein n=1 Tax=Choristoneura fumiferana TaxID=7141 RepID=A0ACC0JLS7_CHOFU|nr:hypothetical protein MSG28_006915 [Choristoneura fumiferana]
MDKKVPPEQKVQANPPEPPKINWDEYKKLVPVEGVVDKLKAEYEKYKIPMPEDTLTKAIDEQWKSLEPQIKAFCAEQQKEIDSATKELSRIKALPAFDQMTMEIFYDMYPGVAIDPVNRPTFWPHNEEEQPGYRTADQKDMDHFTPYEP